MNKKKLSLWISPFLMAAIMFMGWSNITPVAVVQAQGVILTTEHCEEPYAEKFEGEGSFEWEGVQIEVDGDTVTFSEAVEFCVKWSTMQSGKQEGTSYTTPDGKDISYVVVYKKKPVSTPEPQTPPYPSCPSGTENVLNFGPDSLRMPDKLSANFDFQVPEKTTQAWIITWQGVGHNGWDANCEPGDGNDGGVFPCDQSHQENEVIIFDVNGVEAGRFEDIGTDLNKVYTFTVPSASIVKGFNALNLNHINQGSTANSVFYNGSVCITEPEPTETPCPDCPTVTPEPSETPCSECPTVTPKPSETPCPDCPTVTPEPSETPCPDCPTVTPEPSETPCPDCPTVTPEPSETPDPKPTVPQPEEPRCVSYMTDPPLPDPVPAEGLVVDIHVVTINADGLWLYKTDGTLVAETQSTSILENVRLFGSTGYFIAVTENGTAGICEFVSPTNLPPSEQPQIPDDWVPAEWIFLPAIKD